MGDKDFFLNSDDAQTLGDINYMRKSKRVRKTFPKTLKNKDGFEITVDVSSIEDRSKLYNGSGSGNPNTTVFTTPTPSFESKPTFSETYVDTQPQSNGNDSTAEPVEKRRQQDSGMDIFRNMAKGMRRR
ncbi:MAG: hypothetical protein ACFCU5_09460 [Pleurocapsa sp.]